MSTFLYHSSFWMTRGLAVAALVLAASLAAGFSPQSGDSTAQANQHYQNAVGAIAKSDWQTAKNELLAAEKLAPQNALVHYDLALAYSHTGQVKAAQVELNKALQLGLPADQKEAAESLRQRLLSQTAKKTNGTASPSSDSGTNSGSAQAPSPPVDGPSLDETLSFVGRLIGQGSARTEGRHGYTDYRAWSQDSVIVGIPSPCIISWDQISYTHYADGTPPTQQGRDSVTNRTRNFISLKDLLVSDVKIMDFKTWALDRHFAAEGVFGHEGDEYSDTYILAVAFSDDVLTIRNIPNPSGLTGQGSSTWTYGVFFATESDAERAKKALIHAAALCGAKADPF